MKDRIDMTDSHQLPLRDEQDVVSARVEGRTMAEDIGFGLVDQARIATAIAELGSNVVVYGRGGQIVLEEIEAKGRKGLRITCLDQGPGIEDLELAMQDGYSTTRAKGQGLPGAQRLMDEFEIESQVGAGTTVVACKWLP
jgi:serine/threonine-protein kinase RsbT